MEQITKRNGIYYYGERECSGVDEAYSLFRAGYHDSLGKAVYHRLDRIGQRRERVHGAGFVRTSPLKENKFYDSHRVPWRILGIIDIAYCRIFGAWDLDFLPDEQIKDWLDYALTKDSGIFRLVGKNQKTGRTSNGRKRFK